MKHEDFIRQCFTLAKLGETRAFPNPIVGSVIVHNGEVIGQGLHEYCGGPHAEVNAVTDVIKHGKENLLQDSTIYVNLEPCAHHGKTPPCADLIIRHKFKRLVFSSYDPNPLVSGQGLARIRDAGIEIIEPKDLDLELVEASNNLNKPFFKLINNRHCEPTKRSEGGVAIQSSRNYWITLKAALNSNNEFITGSWQTGEEARKAAHRMRSTHQLLVTSIRTVLADNPEYNVRFSAEELALAEIKNPDILILKSSTDFTEAQRKTLRIFDQKYNRKIIEASIGAGKDYTNLKTCMQAMPGIGYQKIMIEAGPKLSQAFREEGLVDEYVEFREWSKDDRKNQSSLGSHLF